MSYMLTIEPTGEQVEVKEGQTLLDAALRSGAWLPHACGHGTCGTCKVDVLAGEVEVGDASPFALIDMEREEGKRLACCATLASDAVIEADVEPEPDARVIPLRNFTAKVTRLEQLTPTIRGIFLQLGADQAIDFQSGQYIQVEIPGLEKPRAFSLANPEAERQLLELHVRRVAGGEATAWLHDELTVGAELRFSGPWGRFYVRKSDPKPLLFMAGGSGLSSPKSMILDLLQHQPERDVTLIYGARNRAELYYHELFLELAARHAHFTYLPALSEPLLEDAWQGEVGMVHEVARQAFDGRFQGRRAYLCGPPPMVEACIRALMQGRLFEKDIFTEKFVTAGDGEAGLARSPLFRSL